MEFNPAYFEKFNTNNVTDTTIAAAVTPGTPDQLFVSIDGNLETLNAHAFGDAVIETIRNSTGLKTIIFDFKHVNYLSSSGVGAIIHILTIQETKPLDVFFLNVNEKIQSVFRVLGFANILKILKEDAYSSKFPLTKQCPKCKAEVLIVMRSNIQCSGCDAHLKLSDDDSLVQTD